MATYVARMSRNKGISQKGNSESVGPERAHVKRDLCLSAYLCAASASSLSAALLFRGSWCFCRCVSVSCSTPGCCPGSWCIRLRPGPVHASVLTLRCARDRVTCASRARCRGVSVVGCMGAEIVHERGIVERVRIVVKRERERTVQVRRNDALERGKVERVCVVVERERGKVGRERGLSWIVAFRCVVHALLINA